MDDYYRQRREQLLIDLENARAARMAALDEALAAVLAADLDVMEEGEPETLRAASAVVGRLHSIW